MIRDTDVTGCPGLGWSLGIEFDGSVAMRWEGVSLRQPGPGVRATTVHESLTSVRPARTQRNEPPEASGGRRRWRDLTRHSQRPQRDNTDLEVLRRGRRHPRNWNGGRLRHLGRRRLAPAGADPRYTTAGLRVRGRDGRRRAEYVTARQAESPDHGPAEAPAEEPRNGGGLFRPPPSHVDDPPTTRPATTRWSWMWLVDVWYAAWIGVISRTWPTTSATPSPASRT